jgi:hypothetical protein
VSHVAAISIMGGLFMSTTYLASPEMQQLTLDMREAMRRANWDGKQTARVIGVSQQRLSDQLLDKEDFTLLRKFKRIPQVWREFVRLQAERTDAVLVVPEGCAATVYRLSDVPLHMLKASLPSDQPVTSEEKRTA